MRLSPLFVSVSLVFAACGDGSEGDSNQRAAKAAFVECSITRLAGGPKKTVKVKIKVEEDAFEGDSLEAFAAHYGFDITIAGGDLNITINEGNFVQDEVGSFICGTIPKKKGVICTEPIFVDKNLGIDDADDEQVKAFEITCKRL